PHTASLTLDAGPATQKSRNASRIPSRATCRTSYRHPSCLTGISAGTVTPVRLAHRRIQLGLSMQFSLTQIQYFVAVANAGSFTIAARQLRVVQPTLSSPLTQLE